MGVVENSKLSVVGAGSVGTSLAYAALIRESASEVALYDIAQEKVDAEVRRIIDWMDRRRALRFDMDEALVGGAAIDALGTPIAAETVTKAKAADAVLFGSVGGPKWDTLGFDMRPEIAILTLRKELGLFANLRPATVLDPLVDASTLKPAETRAFFVA